MRTSRTWGHRGLLENSTLVGLQRVHVCLRTEMGGRRGASKLVGEWMPRPPEENGSTPPERTKIPWC